MIKDLEKTFRWFGPSDAVTLADIRQTGATGIVTALHEVPCGDIWPLEMIAQRQTEIQSHGMRWSVVESVNIHESIRTGAPERELQIANYIQTLRHLARHNIDTVCYNFMPVLDWTRTHLDYRLQNGVSALRFHYPALAAFDLFILNRENAHADYTPQQQQAARQYLDSLNDMERATLRDTILAGLPGTAEVFTVAEFAAHLRRYKHIDAAQLRANLQYFLRAIIPEAEALGIKMCIHPDDPPFPILGLPRIVCTEADLQTIVHMCPSPSNGITFCTGSLGAHPQNDLPGMIERLGPHIHFLHLRNVQREADGSFYEAEHLAGSTNMYAVMKSIISEQQRRRTAGTGRIDIPVRPDHGHKIGPDFLRDTYPGYSLTGRLKGLAELTGLEMGIKLSYDNFNN
ncbi:mannonate dehydratase [Chitinophaga horti]|uniref:Mannonate dehydratase n=1 Tax=Chitinophaga horti TaxID=2920382 RepID=A0ABY6IWC6_9BACT|nr:mannonate dehydratase [Chitinophaga horti]UYQ91685.1 mannonate dehydratase [Chitinophaga horti]